MTDNKKRAASEIEGSERPTKTSKTAKATSPSALKGSTKGGPKAPVGASTFKAHALPLHLNLTHTPPALTGEAAEGSDLDSGLIGTATLLPCTFSTGSFGWKGNKRITVELLNNEDGVKEKVQVMLTVNATVLGSKHAKESDGVGEAGESVGKESARSESQIED